MGKESESRDERLQSGVQSTDESIVAFATVREEVMSSDPSFGDWKNHHERGAGKTYGDDVVPCMIEVTRGSPNKYEVEKETGMLVLDRVLHSAVHYPGDYGYIPATLCGDGDPLDLLIISPYAAQHKGLEPGTIANCRIVGLMDMEDESGRDEKIIAVLDGMKSCSHIKSLDTIPPHLQREIQHFFESYKKLEKKAGKPKWARVIGWGDKAQALRVLHESRERHEEKLRQVSGEPSRFDNLWAPNMLHAPQLEKGVRCYINTVKGTTCSYQYRHDTSFRHYRHTLNMPFPGDAGWISQTWQRGVKKPLEVIVLSVFPLVSESLVNTRLIGALKRSYINSSGQFCEDYKTIAVPIGDPRAMHILSLDNINPSVVDHYEDFVQHSATMNGCTQVKILARLNAVEAAEVFRVHHLEYQEDFPNRRVTNAPNLWCLPWPVEDVNVDNNSVTAVIECPKGSCNKYEFDRELGCLVLQRPLFSATYWPGNYGFIPQTVAEDGRPVNVLVLSNHPLNEFSLCTVRIIGSMMCIDEKGPDLKVVAVPKKEPRMAEWKDADHIPSHIKSEMENFFNTYKSLESNWNFCRVQKWKSASETIEYLRLAHTRFFLFVLPMERVEGRLKKIEDENKELRQQLQLANTKL
eukprot:TRINITY_DN21008_c2_g2_i2.p2 TRINITY_DN21008_c2_g2~~TRINITY_DN21008_c2_g2_i2.p2  ORF type:complete len:651 (+),score=302.52 TRINITY_DN21008_c2_g2_i2:47-1954(+)